MGNNTNRSPNPTQTAKGRIIAIPKSLISRPLPSAQKSTIVSAGLRDLTNNLMATGEGKPMNGDGTAKPNLWSSAATGFWDRSKPFSFGQAVAKPAEPPFSGISFAQHEPPPIKVTHSVPMIPRPDIKPSPTPTTTQHLTQHPSQPTTTTPKAPKPTTTTPTTKAKARPKSAEAKMISQMSTMPSNPPLPTAVEPALLTAIVNGSIKQPAKGQPTPRVFNILNEQHGQQTKVDPAYCMFACRFMHTANTMDGGHRISRYSDPDAFCGMQSTTPIPTDWVQVPKPDTFTLGNGVVILGGSQYKRVKGAIGTAIRVEGLIAVGTIERPTENPADGGRMKILPVMVNVLPTQSIMPFPLHRFKAGTRIGRHLKLLEGAFLDSDCVLHGPFVYKGMLLCENEVIHADGTFARFHDNTDQLLPNPNNPAKPLPKSKSKSHSEKKIYVEMCIDRLLTPLPASAFGTDEDFRTSLGLTARDAAAATIVTAAVAASAAAVVTSSLSTSPAPSSSSSSEGPKLDCFGYDSTILPYALSAALLRGKTVSHANTVEADGIRSVEEERRCGFCGILKRREKVQFCGRCKVVRYCGKRCQVEGWKAGHRRWCVRRDDGTGGGDGGVM